MDPALNGVLLVDSLGVLQYGMAHQGTSLIH